MLRPAESQSPPSLAQLAGFFLQLGTMTFGGPAVHIAVMEDQLVRRRQWISRDDFLDLLGAANLLPGPSSTELAIYIGYRLGGVPGLLIAGVCFILPAALIVCVLAWAYVRYGMLPATAAVLYGVKPIVIALVLQALWRLGRAAVKTRYLALIGAISATLAIIPINPLAILCVGGVLAAIGVELSDPDAPASLAALPGLISPRVGAGVARGSSLAMASLSAAQIGLAPLFGAFLKIGCVVFGSGYVLLAFLQDDLVQQRHWLTTNQLLDAVAVGQITPGPLFTTATFIGYLLAGPRGAALATIAIFLPGFLLVAATGRFIPRLRQSWYAGAFLDGLNVASLGLMAVVLANLAKTALIDPPTISIAIASAAILLTTRINPAWLLVVAAIVGAAIRGGG